MLLLRSAAVYGAHESAEFIGNKDADDRLVDGPCSQDSWIRSLAANLSQPAIVTADGTRRTISTQNRLLMDGEFRTGC